MTNLKLPKDYQDFCDKDNSKIAILLSAKEAFELYPKIKSMLISGEGRFDNYLPIARIDGLIVLMSLEEDNLGHIYIWDNDFADFFEAIKLQRNHLAENFYSFVIKYVI